MKSAYWDKKILKWEFLRYSPLTYWHPGSWSVRSRFSTSLAYIQKIQAEKRRLVVLDLGCGSGSLLSGLKNKDIRYYGFDFSEKAIAKAKNKFSSFQHSFVSQDLEKVHTYPAADLAVMLGITDWIQKTTLECLLRQVLAPRLLISYTSQKESFRKHIYQLYRRNYDNKNTVCPHDFSDQEFTDLYTQAGWSLEKDLTTSVMSPGKLLCLSKRISIT